MSGNICIFTRPIRTRKTTELQDWTRKNTDVAGILTPDIGGKRILTDIGTDVSYEFELSSPSKDFLSVGRFHFSSEIIQKAQQILLNCIGAKWLIIDEVGKLEVESDSGLEPAISQIISLYKNNPPADSKLLLVIRDTLLDKAMNKYGLSDAQVINSLNSI